MKTERASVIYMLRFCGLVVCVFYKGVCVRCLCPGSGDGPVLPLLSARAQAGWLRWHIFTQVPSTHHDRA